MHSSRYWRKAACRRLRAVIFGCPGLSVPGCGTPVEPVRTANPVFVVRIARLSDRAEKDMRRTCGASQYFSLPGCFTDAVYQIFQPGFKVQDGYPAGVNRNAMINMYNYWLAPEAGCQGARSYVHMGLIRDLFTAPGRPGGRPAWGRMTVSASAV